jgi:hypothetical protein
LNFEDCAPHIFVQEIKNRVQGVWDFLSQQPERHRAKKGIGMDDVTTRGLALFTEIVGPKPGAAMREAGAGNGF